VKYSLSLFVVLAMLWVFNSGIHTPLLLGLGLVSVLFVVWIAHAMDVVDHESQPVNLTWKMPGFYLWLALKIIVANIDVVKRVWRGNNAITPCGAILPMTQATDMGRVIYANSLTLTPATVAMDVTAEGVLVHALTREAMDELIEGEMGRRVVGLEN